MKVRQRLPTLGMGVFAWAIAAVFLALPACAMDDVQARQTLRGLGALRVTVEVDALIRDRHPSLRDRLRGDVETRLQEAGIAMEPAAMEWLHVSLHTHDASPGFAFSIHVDLEQLVRLMRGPHLVTLSPTWGTGGVGVLPDLSPASLEFLRTSVLNSVDQFVAAYRRENPSRLGER